jgi:hypothetical protein
LIENNFLELFSAGKKIGGQGERWFPAFYKAISIEKSNTYRPRMQHLNNQG